jgi:hypothetical protein
VQQIIVHTYNENLIYKNSNSNQVTRWRLFIQKYSPDWKYIKGNDDVIADALNRLPKDKGPLTIPWKLFILLWNIMQLRNLTTPSIHSHMLNLGIAQQAGSDIRKKLTVIMKSKSFMGEEWINH